MPAESKNLDPAPLDEKIIGQYFRTGWQTFQRYPLGFILFCLLTLAIKLGIIILSKKTYLTGWLLGCALYPVYVGDYLVAAQLLQGRPRRFVDFFSGCRHYWPLLIFGLILGTINLVPYFLWFSKWLSLLAKLASLIFIITYLFTPLLIVERRLKFFQAMQISRQAVQPQAFAFLIFIFYGFLLLLPGSVALFMGMRAALARTTALMMISGAGLVFLVALPVLACAVTAAYADLFGFQSNEY
jgi:hypothetical protein